jgi:hypothetical protein
MNTVQILNAISSISFFDMYQNKVPVQIGNVWHPYSDDQYLNADLHFGYGYSVYSFKLSLYVDQDIINIEIDGILNQNFKHSDDYVNVITTLIENNILEQIKEESIAVWSREEE